MYLGNLCFSNTFPIKICLDIQKKFVFEVTNNMVIYIVAMLQISSRWDPFEPCRPIIDEAPVFYPTYEVPLNYDYHVPL
jgi:hypothetical protein